MKRKPDNRPRLLAIGGAHIDRRGQVTGDYVPAASNPGAMIEDVGGVVFNALRTSVRRGVAGALVSLRGGDGAGEQIARTIAEAGIEDLSATFMDRSSASYTALIDRHGELIAGFADMGLYDQFPRQLRRAALRQAMAEADAVLCDANLPAAALEAIGRHSAGPIYAIGISPAKVVRLTGILDRVACLFMNRKEAMTLTGQSGLSEPGELIKRLRATGLRGAVVTDGSGPVIYFDETGAGRIAPPAPRHVADVTGAGDALAGATVAARMTGRPLGDALRDGLAAAMLALESPQAVPPFTKRIFDAALRLVPQPTQLPTKERS